MILKSNNTFEEINCPLCLCTKYKKIAKTKCLGNNIFISHCVNCGLIYLNPRWNKKQYEKYYKYSYDKDYRKTKNKEIENKNYEVILERLATNNYLPANNIKILDMGAGNGYGLAAIRKKFINAELYAIEPSEKAQKKLHQNKIKNWAVQLIIV